MVGAWKRTQAMALTRFCASVLLSEPANIRHRGIMPVIYRIIRSDGVTTGQLPEGAAGAVIYGGNEGEMVSEHLAILKDDALVVIRHPIEVSDLQANGETFESANEKGILFHVEPHLCSECGKTIQVPRLSYRLRGGCLGPLLIGMGSGVAVMVLTPAMTFFSVIIAAGLGVGLALAVWECCSRIARNRKFGQRMEQTEVNSCATCGCDRLIAVPKIGRKGLILKNGLVVRVGMAGRS
jgi:hypothetical protein